MTEASTESRWCPSCGDEFEPEVSKCADCRVPLVDDRPSELSPRAAEGEIEAAALTSFDLAELDQRQRAELLSHLDARPVPHGFIDEHTIVAVPGYEDELSAAVASVRGGGRPGGRPALPLAGRPAGLVRRAIARALDTIVFVAIVVAIEPSLGLGNATMAALAAAAANHVIGVGERARSVGKAIVGCRVRRRSGAPLTTGEAFMRWVAVEPALALVSAATVGIAIDASVNGLIVAVAGAATAAVAWSVVSSPVRRGLHDVLVDGAVFDSGSIGGSDEYVSQIDIVS